MSVLVIVACFWGFLACFGN